MVRYNFLLLLAFMFSKYSEGKENITSNNLRVSSDSSLTFLALGDSYTIGESVDENERWYIQLINDLKKEEIFVAQADVIAKTGWTTGELIKAIEESGNTKTYSVVSLLIGVNNQYRGQSVETYREEFRELLSIATNFAGGETSKVLVLSIPDWAVTPFAAAKNVNIQKISQEIDSFNAAAKEECEKLGIIFINITGISRRAKNEQSYIADDELHFSGKMYKLWARETFPVMKKVLKK